MLKKNFFSLSKIALLFGCIANPMLLALADTDSPTTNDAEKAYLVQIINQLDAMQPLILAAQNAQLANKRVQFHYARYQDIQGQPQNGLLEDVRSIKTGITQYLNEPAIEPRSVQPLQGDYLNLKPVQSNPSDFVSTKQINAPNTAEVLNANG